MVIRADVLAAAIDAVSPADDPRPRLLMSPRGRPLEQARKKNRPPGRARCWCAAGSRAWTSG